MIIAAFGLSLVMLTVGAALGYCIGWDKGYKSAAEDAQETIREERKVYQG